MSSPEFGWAESPKNGGGLEPGGAELALVGADEPVGVLVFEGFPSGLVSLGQVVADCDIVGTEAVAVSENCTVADGGEVADCLAGRRVDGVDWSFVSVCHGLLYRLGGGLVGAIAVRVGVQDP